MNNAAAYNNGHLIYGLHLVGKAVGLPVHMFIHTETQDVLMLTSLYV